MSDSQVEYQLPKTLLEATSKNASFNSDKFAVNNNKNVCITLHTSAQSSLNSTCLIQGSQDGTTWADLTATSTSVTTNDDVMWTLHQLDAVMFIRVKVTISAGSAIFIIIARGA